MVRVGVGQDDRVDLSNPLVPEEGGDDVAAHVEAIVVETAPVYKHPFSAGEFDEGATGVAHIEEGDAQRVPVLKFPVKPGGIAGQEDHGQRHHGQRFPPGPEDGEFP